MRFLLTLCLLVLVGCADKNSPDYVARPVLTERMRTAADWSHIFPDVYDGMQECIAYHDSPPAIALDVKTQEGSSLITVVVQGRNEKLMECTNHAFGGGVLHLQPMEAADTRRKTRFTPVNAGEPNYRCYDNEPVKDTAGRLLGWISYSKC